jgi:type I restriction enzyme S subunit
MKTNLQTYTNYKPSNVEWLGDIPQHWEVKKLGFIGQFSASGIDKYIKPSESKVKIINFTDVYGNLNKIIDSSYDFMEVTTPETNRIKHLVKKGDLIFLPSSETYEDLGMSALVDTNLENTSFSYHVIRLVLNEDIEHSFRKYITNNTFVQNQFSRAGKGSTRKIIGRGVFKNVQVIIPPFSEQTAIAKFLDDKTAKIDQAITIKKNQIELLKERKHSLINKAVTKGINHNAKLKDSDVEWIGQIPEHWQVKRLKYVFQILKRISGELGHSVLSITQKGIKVKDTESGAGQLSMDYSKYQFVYKGDFAMNHMDLLTGYVDISKYDGVISPDYRVFDLIEPNSNKEYMLLLLQLCYSNKVFYAHGQGVSMLGRWRFPAENFNIFPFPVPPKSEQIEIADFIAKTNKKIAKAISLKEKEIEVI